MTLEEKMMQRQGVESLRKPEAAENAEQRIADLEAQNEMLTECILELSELLYN